MKLTKPELKLHEEAMRILTQPRLTDDEKEFVLDHYHPGATNNLTKAAIFFTPRALANTTAMFAASDGHILDACAGIGALAYHAQFHGNPDRITCIEQNPEFVEIGRKIVPDAEWIRGDIFEQVKDRTFTTGLSNPPFGNICTLGVKTANIRRNGIA